MRITNSTNLAFIVQYRRKSLQISQQKLSNLSSISPRAIYELEAGNSSITFKNLIRILDVLGLQMNISLSGAPTLTHTSAQVATKTKTKTRAKVETKARAQAKARARAEVDDFDESDANPDFEDNLVTSWEVDPQASEKIIANWWASVLSRANSAE